MIYSMQSKDGSQNLKAELTEGTTLDAILADFATHAKWWDTEPVGGRVEHHHYDVIEHASHAEHASGARGRRIGNIAKRREQHPVFNPAAGLTGDITPTEGELRATPHGQFIPADERSASADPCAERRCRRGSVRKMTFSEPSTRRKEALQ